MLKVYAPPKEITPPSWASYKDVQLYNKAEENYTNSIIDFCKKYGKGKHRGDVVRFPVADGYAVYVIYSESPMELIHDESGDAYQYMYVERLTKKDILQLAESYNKLKKMFGGK